MEGIGKAGLSIALSLGLVAAAVVDGAAQQQDQLVSSAAEVTIPLQGDVSGQAVLTEAGEQTRVALDVSGAAPNAALSGVLVSGACAEGGDMIAELGEIQVGESGSGSLSSELPIDLETIESSTVSVQVRPAGQADAAPVACGERAAEALADEPAAAEPLPSPIPTPGQEPDAADPFPAPAPDPTQP